MTHTLEIVEVLRGALATAKARRAQYLQDAPVVAHDASDVNVQDAISMIRDGRTVVLSSTLAQEILNKYGRRDQRRRVLCARGR